LWDEREYEAPEACTGCPLGVSAILCPDASQAIVSPELAVTRTPRVVHCAAQFFGTAAVGAVPFAFEP